CTPPIECVHPLTTSSRHAWSAFLFLLPRHHSDSTRAIPSGLQERSTSSDAARALRADVIFRAPRPSDGTCRRPPLPPPPPPAPPPSSPPSSSFSPSFLPRPPCPPDQRRPRARAPSPFRSSTSASRPPSSRSSR